MQKYDKDFAFMINIINLKIINKIVFERHKIFIIIKINENQRFNKIIINEFVR